MPRDFTFLPERTHETDDEKRLREALTRQAEGMMKALDSAIQLRTASSETSRMRAMARTALQDACLRAMAAFTISSR